MSLLAVAIKAARVCKAFSRHVCTCVREWNSRPSGMVRQEIVTVVCVSPAVAWASEREGFQFLLSVLARFLALGASPSALPPGRSPRRTSPRAAETALKRVEMRGRGNDGDDGQARRDKTSE